MNFYPDTLETMPLNRSSTALLKAKLKLHTPSSKSALPCIVLEHILRVGQKSTPKLWPLLLSILSFGAPLVWSLGLRHWFGDGFMSYKN